MYVLIRGGGDLASGVAMRLHRAGLKVLITEIPQPLAVRRLVSFSDAVYAGQMTVEGVTGVLAADLSAAQEIIERGKLPVLVDPDAKIRVDLKPKVLVDARMTKRPPDLDMQAASLVIGLGPGFIAGENCHAVVETLRGHHLGRVIWRGQPEPDSGLPEPVGGKGRDRVLRAPESGILLTLVNIGDPVAEGQSLAEVADHEVLAPFRGVVRGLLRAGVAVRKGLKIGDIDPRGDATFCHLISDKSLAIGGGVLEAILSRADLRPLMWD
jgi:xanthine dehydrogenase accessory factor